MRNERTPSFFVNTAKNAWFDHGIGKGGNPVDFACAYLESRGLPNKPSDGLRWLGQLFGQTPPHFNPAPSPSLANQESKLVLSSVRSLEYDALIEYLKKRGIPLNIARRYLKEVRLYNKETRRSFYALGFKNDDDGFEVRNPYFKGCIGPKAISFRRGIQPKPQSVHIFEGFMDFLTLVVCNEGKALRGDAMILNSLSCLKQTQGYIRGYGYHVAYTWLDNDKAGVKATHELAEFFKTEKGLIHKPFNRLYHGHKDLNDWHVHRLNQNLIV